MTMRRTIQRVLILGAGGHGAVVADILQQRHAQHPEWEPIGFLDDDPARHRAPVLGLPVLGKISDLSGIAHDAVILAIGNNTIRQTLYVALLAQGEQFAVACHPRAIVAPDVTLGPGTVVAAGVVVNPGTRIGENVILNTGCTVDHHNHVHEHVHIAPGAHLGGDVVIETGALVGMGALILPGRRVGTWAQVGAGAVVTKDLPPGAVAMGVPAKPVRFSS